jgi:hypothetical protein
MQSMQICTDCKVYEAAVWPTGLGRRMLDVMTATLGDGVEALRRVFAAAVRGCAVLGAAFCGNAELLVAMQRSPARPPNHIMAPEAVDQETADGIAQIEAFLAANVPRPKSGGGTSGSLDRDQPPASPPVTRDEAT